MGLYGAIEQQFSQFAGLCLDVDAAELPPALASLAANVDLYGGTLRLRRGRSPYNGTAAHASKALGLFDYYPVSGATMIPLIATAGDGKVWADTNSDGDFGDAGEAILTGLSTSATWMELFGYQDRVYGGNGIDALWRWNGSGTAAAVTAMTAPGVALLSPVLYEIEACEAAWTAGTPATHLTQGNGSDVGYALEAFHGSDSSRFTASDYANGSNYKKAFSAGTQDLSAYRWLRLYFTGGYARIVGQVALQDATGSLNFDLWPTLPAVARKGQWQEYYLPLDALAPADRTACPGLGFRWVHRNEQYAFPQSLFLDYITPIADLVADEYSYSCTFYDTVNRAESGPSATAKLTFSNPLSGLAVAAPATGASSTAANTKVFIYRARKTGFWRLPRKVGELAYLNGVTLGAAIATTGTPSVTVSSGAHIANGDLVRVDSELLKVTAGGGTTALTVARGWGGTVAATHTNGTALRLVLFDVRSDGDVDVAAATGTGGTDGTDGQELRTALMAPPIAQAYVIGNHRMFAANVTISGTNYPWRVYVSRQGFPEEFSSVPNPDDPGVAGWFDLPDRGRILRMEEMDGVILIFTDRSVWTWEGSGFNDAVVTRRAQVGLAARWAVAISSRRVFFLADDGLRVLELTAGAEREFPCWVVSEPVRSLLQAIPYNYRTNAALGVDDLGRVHLSLTRSGQTVNDAALVLDPRIPGALDPAPNPARPGWTYYTGWGFSVSRTLRNGSGAQSGGMLVGDPSTGKLHRFGIDQFGRDLAPESGGVAWYWQSAAVDAGPGMQRMASFLSLDPETTNSQKVRLTAILDGTTGTGLVASAARKTIRLAATDRGRRLQVRIDSADPASNDGEAGTLGAHTLAFSLRSAALGLLAPQTRG